MAAEKPVAVRAPLCRVNFAVGTLNGPDGAVDRYPASHRAVPRAEAGSLSVPLGVVECKQEALPGG